MQKSKKIIFASHNKGKISEIKEILHPFGITVLSGEDIDALLKLLRFFKSYTVSIRQAHIQLMLDDRYDNMIHVIEDMKFNVKMSLGEKCDIDDVMHEIHGLIKMSDNSTQAIEQIAMLVYNLAMTDGAIGIHKPKFNAVINQADNGNTVDTIDESGIVTIDNDRYSINTDTIFLTGMDNTYNKQIYPSFCVKITQRYTASHQNIRNQNYYS